MHTYVDIFVDKIDMYEVVYENTCKRTGMGIKDPGCIS